MDGKKELTGDFLHIYQKNGTTKIPLKSGKTFIGTSSTSDIRLKNEDKLNCFLESDISGVFVLINDQQDKRIRVNGKFCNKYIVLKHGDCIHVGNQKFQFTNDKDKKDELKPIQQCKQRQIGRKSVFLPISRQSTPQSTRLAVAHKTPRSSNLDLKKRTPKTETPCKNPILNRRSSTGNRRALIRKAVLNRSAKSVSDTPIEKTKSVQDSGSTASLTDEIPVLHRRSLITGKTPKGDKNMKRRFSTSNSKTPNSNPAGSVLRNLRSASITRQKLELVKEISVSLSLPQEGNAENLEVPTNDEPTPNSDTNKRRSKSCDSSTPRNNVSAISITPLKASKKNSNTSFVDDSQSSTPKSALKPRKSASFYRPIVEDISPVTPQLRPSTLKKPTFMERRSMKLDAFNSFSESGESLDDSDSSESTRTPPKNKNQLTANQMTSNEFSVDQANIPAGKENQSANTSFHSCPDQDQNEDLEDLFKTPQQVPLRRRWVKTSDSKTSLNVSVEAPSSETDDDPPETEKRHRLGDSDIESDVTDSELSFRTSIAETTSMDGESLRTDDSTDDDDVSDLKQSFVGVNAGDTTSNRSSLVRTMKWDAKDDSPLNPYLDKYSESSADENELSPSRLQPKVDVASTDCTSASSERLNRRSFSLNEYNRPKSRRYSGTNKDAISKSFSSGKISRRSSRTLRRQSAPLCSIHERNSSPNMHQFKKKLSSSGKISNTSRDMSARQSIPYAEFSFGDVSDEGNGLANQSNVSKKFSDITLDSVNEEMPSSDVEMNRRSLALIEDYCSGGEGENADVEEENAQEPTFRFERAETSDDETCVTSAVVESLPVDEVESLDIRQSASFEKGQDIPAEKASNKDTNNDDAENIRQSPSFAHRINENVGEDQQAPNVGLSVSRDSEYECHSNDISYSNIDSSSNEEETSLIDNAANEEKTDDLLNRDTKQLIVFSENLEDAAEFMEAPPSVNDQAEEHNESNEIPSLRLSTGNNSVNDESFKAQTTPKNADIRNVTPKKEKSPLNDLTNPVAVKTLMATPKIQKSPSNDLTNVSGVKLIMATPKSSLKDLTNPIIVKTLLKAPKSPLNDLTNPVGVKTLMKTPKEPKSPLNDLSNPVGVKTLMKTPRAPKSPLNDLTSPVGVKTLMKTPKVQKTPKNDLTNPVGVKTLMKTPKVQKTPKNDLTNPVGVKALMKTPTVQKTPKNDLTNVAGVKSIFSTPKEPKSPLNDLTNPVGVKSIMVTPKVQNSPKNDLTNVGGVKRIFSSPKEPKSPLNDLTNPVGVKSLMATPKNQASPKNDLMNVTGVSYIFQATPGKETENVSLAPQMLEQPIGKFDSLLRKKPMRTYSRTPNKSLNQTEISPKSTGSEEKKEAMVNNTSMGEKTEQTDSDVKKVSQKRVTKIKKTTQETSVMSPSFSSSTPITQEITPRPRRSRIKQVSFEEQGNESLKTIKNTSVKGRKRNGTKIETPDVEQEEEISKVDDKEVETKVGQVNAENSIKTRTRRDQAKKAVETVSIDDESTKNRSVRGRKRIGTKAKTLDLEQKEEVSEVADNEIETNVAQIATENSPIKMRTRRVQAKKIAETVSIDDEATKNTSVRGRKRIATKTETPDVEQKEEISKVDDNGFETNGAQVVREKTPIKTRTRRVPAKNADETVSIDDESTKNDEVPRTRHRRAANKVIEKAENNDSEVRTRTRKGQKKEIVEVTDNSEKDEIPKLCEANEKIENASENIEVDEESSTRRLRNKRVAIQEKLSSPPKPRATRGRNKKILEVIENEGNPKSRPRKDQKKKIELDQETYPAQNKLDEDNTSETQEAKPKRENKRVEINEKTSVRKTRQKKTEEKIEINDDEAKEHLEDGAELKTREMKRQNKKIEIVVENENEGNLKPVRRLRQKRTEEKIEIGVQDENKDNGKSINGGMIAEPLTRKTKKINYKETQVNANDENKITSKSPRAKKAKITKADPNEKDSSIEETKNPGASVSTPQTASPRRTARQRIANLKYGEEEWITPIKTPSKRGVNTRKKTASPEALLNDSSETIIRRSKRARK